MKSLSLISGSPQETIRLGQTLAGHSQAGDILCLFGDLGTGKTTLVKGMAQGLKIQKAKVNSPSFVLLNIYQGRFPLYHFDFYRLTAVREILEIGIDEFLYDQGVSVIEWADRMKSLLPSERLEIRLSHEGPHKRKFRMIACGRRYQDLLMRINRR